MKGDVGKRQPSRQTQQSCVSLSCSLMLWWSFSLWLVICQLIWVDWTPARSLANITLGWNLMQRCVLSTPQGRELDILEPVFLHPLSKNSQWNPEVWKMGREEAGATGRKTTLPVFGTVFLCALWLSMCSLLKWSSSSLKQRFSRYLKYTDKVRECIATVKYPSTFW